VIVEGEDITGLPPSARTRRGLGRAFQLTNLFPDLTALENVRLAVQSRADAGWSLLRVWNSRRDLIEKAESVLEKVRLADKRHIAPKALSHGDQRKLEVALLIAMEPKVFMFDEPTAGMSIDEVPTVLELIHDIKQRPDSTVLLVEHKMDVVRSLADRIVVLHNGALVADGEPTAVIASPVVQQAYLGLEAGDA
jgi:branched-chain amino acid transport system ATP-binding protein